MTVWSQASERVRCMRTMPLLQSYLDGALDDDSACRVAAHLEDCRRCGLEISVYTEIKQALAARPRPIDAGVVDRLRSFAARLTDAGPGDEVPAPGDRGA